ncbi:MAG: UDP-N-acetylmuramate dehydrogenase [bacterium]
MTIAATINYEEIAREISAKIKGTVSQSEEMCHYTTFHVGGPADLFITPVDFDDLLVTLKILRNASLPVMTIGNGSNMLVSDLGIRGGVLKLQDEFNTITRENNDLIIGAGANLQRVVNFAAKQSLSGLESTQGIPGTIGGALVMNAGTDIGHICDLVHSVDVVTFDGIRHTITKCQLQYGYRNSSLQNMDCVVVSACLRLVPGEQEAIMNKMNRLREKRTSRQPYGARTAGSTFINPDKIAAGKLLDRSGCKGMQIGGAAVSDKHANFIITHEGVRATDIITLSEKMQKRVFDVFGVQLKKEIVMAGDWKF